MKTKTPSQQPTASIYRNQNAMLRALFERASDPRKVLCVALDYAKRKHVALCCDGNGDILRQPFAVALRNNRGSLQRDNMWRCGVLFRFSDGFFQIVRGMRFQKEGSARSRKASGGAGKFKSW